MSKTIYILSAMIMMLLASCNEEVEHVGSRVSRVAVPICLITGHPAIDDTRAIGDPGYDDALPPTRYLYAWAYYQTSGTTYNVEYSRAELDESDWEDDDKETTESHYTTEELGFSFINAMAGDDIGKVYVIASNKELSMDELKAIYTPAAGNSADYSEGMWTVEVTAAPALGGTTLDLAAWTSRELRDLYSNPIGDTATDGNSLGNGVIKKAGNTVTTGTIRLYHCAAKVDFKWEVAEELRATTSVSNITCTGLPTTLKVFEPTSNPIGDAQCQVLGTTPAAAGAPTPANVLTPANMYIGRAYAYVLQPTNNDKKVNYTVDFAVPVGAPDGTAPRLSVTTTTAAPTSSPYTTWYRVVAAVKN